MDPLQITISNCDPNPNGNAARLSRTGTDYPNQAQWRALDKDYQVDLPPSVWSAPPGAQLSFTIQQNGPTSAVYTVKPTAQTGQRGYDIGPCPEMAGPPTVLIEP